MLEYVVLDIETVPIDYEDREIVDYLIRKDFSRDFHPFFAKVVCVGLKPAGKAVTTFAGDDEKDVLEGFWEELESLEPKLVVTFNGIQFDVPFLKARSVIAGVKPTMEIETNKWQMESSNHFDCMQALSLKGAFPWVSQEIACRVLGIPVEEDHLGGDRIRELFLAEDWKAIKKHNAQDLEMTEQLFLKIRQFLGP